MKRSLTLTITALSIAAFVSACAGKASAYIISSSAASQNDPYLSTEISEDMVGAYHINDDFSKARLPEVVQKIFNNASENYTGMSFEPIAVIGAQVVAGMNYNILCKGTVIYPGAEAKLVTVTIYADLEGNASITDVQDFNLSKYVGTDKTEEYEELAGGWFAYTDNVCSVPQDILKSFEAARTKRTDNEYVPVAYLGSQVVAGTNNAILCIRRPVKTEFASWVPCIVTVYNGIDGENSILSSCDYSL